MITRRTLLAGVPAVLSAARPAPPPSPYGAVPSPRQLAWHELEFTAFLHFTVNTFTNKEWGYGDEDPNLFNPEKFDADAIVGALADAGMRGVILTCKHHDGFCLWPTKTTDHSVFHSAWRGGKGDVVRDISQAAARRRLKFGVYLSPWDRNSAQYGTPEYIKTYRAQLSELLTGYGPIFEVWHDGANGGDGYYGGAREKRTIDKNTYYDWPRTWEMIRAMQPEAVVFSDVGPDVRWVGNERGIAGDPCWAGFDPVGEDGGPASPGNVRTRESTSGQRHASKWLPAECDVSIRPGWFWHEAENARVKKPAQLASLYYQSVGRGATLLLNVPPNRDGLLSREDIASLQGFGAYLKGTFAQNLAARGKADASHFRGNDKQFGAAKLLDGLPDTYWATDDHVTSADVTIDWADPVKFQVIRLKEAIRFGQRIDAFSVERWQADSWMPVASSTSIGPRRLIQLDAPIIATRLRLRITQASASPALSEFAVFGSCRGLIAVPLVFLYWFFVGPALLLAVLSLRGERKRANYAARRLAEQPEDLPPVTLIVPVKGYDEGLRENLEALAALDYPDYELIITAHTAGDIPVGVLPARVRVVLAHGTASGPEKIQNLTAAVRAARKRTQVLAFADSDGRVTSGWLRALVAPLAEPGVGASTGYRWFLPDPPDFWSLMRGVWDAVAAGMLGAGDNAFAWGGAMAIRKELFFEARVPDYWQGALTDDYSLSEAVHAAGLTIAYAPGALTPCLEHTTAGRFFGWIRRQLAITRIHAPRLWWPALVAHTFYCGGMAASVIASIQGNRLAEWALVAQLSPGMLKGLNRATLAKAALPGYEAWFKRHSWVHAIWVPLATWVWLIGLVASAIARSIEWRGRRYPVKRAAGPI